MPAKRGERKETNTKKTLLISLLIGNALGAAIFFILLSIASAVMLKKGVSSGAYTPVSIVCAAIAAFIAGLFSVIPIRKTDFCWDCVHQFCSLPALLYPPRPQAAV